MPRRITVSTEIGAAEIDAHRPPPTLAHAAAACRREEVAEVYNTPLLDLVFSAATVHRMYNDPAMVSLLRGHA